MSWQQRGAELSPRTGKSAVAVFSTFHAVEASGISETTQMLREEPGEPQAAYPVPVTLLVSPKSSAEEQPAAAMRQPGKRGRPAMRKTCQICGVSSGCRGSVALPPPLPSVQTASA